MRKEPVVRVGDMHPNRALSIYVQWGGDVVVHITQDGIPIGDLDTGNANDRAAQIEFCTSGGRSRHTREALMNLIVAMEKDNAEWPITQS